LIFDYRHLKREHSKTKDEADNIVEESRVERVEWFTRKKKCPECRLLFSIKTSFREHLSSHHGWSQAHIQKIITTNKEPVWLCLPESDTEN
jgi:uncharacterized C2H2 Zn-finger protein